MNGPAFYASQNMLKALYSLATGPGDVRKRLLTAYGNFWVLTEDHFPEHLRADFRFVMKELRKFGPVYDRDGNMVRDAVEETLQRIKNRTGVKIANKLVHLYFELEGYLNKR
jgi:hypothetical protein